jgi:hypothetical protein
MARLRGHVEQLAMGKVALVNAEVGEKLERMRFEERSWWQNRYLRDIFLIFTNITLLRLHFHHKFRAVVRNGVGEYYEPYPGRARAIGCLLPRSPAAWASGSDRPAPALSTTGILAVRRRALADGSACRRPHPAYPGSGRGKPVAYRVFAANELYIALLAYHGDISEVFSGYLIVRVSAALGAFPESTPSWQS